MKKYSFPVIILLSFFSSCTTKIKEEKASVDLPLYEMKTFRVESEGGCESDSRTCAFYSVTYPHFSNLSQATSETLHKKINEVMQIGDPETTSLPFDSAGVKFIHDYEKFTAEFPEPSMGWSFDGEVKVDSLSNSLISMVATTQYYTGGAHGGYGNYFINIDPATGKVLTLDDILKPGYKEPLNQIGETMFNEEYLSNDSIPENTFEFPDGKFKLNDNYGVLKDGIHFFYNIYEIAPYSAGTQEIIIPYNRIKDWMK
jgi:hypothetical protein